MVSVTEDDALSSGNTTTTAAAAAVAPAASRARPTEQALRHPALDRQTAPSTAKTGVQQPKPHARPRPSGPASIIVSPRQKGNPVLDKIKSMQWEYGDTPADYVLGVTTCALFLSLKYHRLHPEYIYTRIQKLQGKYALRIVLCMVDIQNHEESLKELSKTSIINNVTIVLCWSAAEGARYLELFKTYEHAAPTSIKQHHSTAYSDRMVDFITTPRSINKTDAVSLVSQFGTIRTAVSARHEEVAMIAGWGEKKVQQWCNSVSEPFRTQHAAKRGIQLENLVASQSVSSLSAISRDLTVVDAPGPSSRAATADADRRPVSRLTKPTSINNPFKEDEEALTEALAAESAPLNINQASDSDSALQAAKKRRPSDAPLSDGVMAALNKLRKT